jgi:DNA-cytosine methyltransferase
VHLALSTDGAEHTPTAIDLFSGVGGTALGLEWAGFDVRLAVDCDEAKARWLASNHPEAKVLGLDGTEGDVLKIEPGRLLSEAGLSAGELSLLAGCPPCQGYSLQGNRDVEDERNLLYRRYVTFVEALRPAAIGFENVPGMETIGDGCFLSDLLSELDRIGYDVRVFHANARSFGLPQDRERIFVVGLLESSPSLPAEREHSEGSGPSILDLPERALIEDEQTSKPVTYRRPPASAYARALRYDRRRPKVRNCEVTRHAEKIVRRFRALDPGETDEPTHHRRLDPDEPSTTLTAGTPSRTACRPVHPRKDRVLTVREAARLTSFPDWYQFPRQIAEAWCLIGNAVPPLMAREVFRPLWANLAGQ